LVPIDEWRRLHGAPVRTLKELPVTDEGRGEPSFRRAAGILQAGAALRLIAACT